MSATIETMVQCRSNSDWSKEVAGSKGKTYTVSFCRQYQKAFMYDFECTCPSFKYRPNQYCKHIKAVEKDRCGWSEQMDGGYKGDGKCPRCGDKVDAVRVAV